MLRPVLLTLYVCFLGNNVRRPSMQIHCYADDVVQQFKRPTAVGGGKQFRWPTMNGSAGETLQVARHGRSGSDIAALMADCGSGGRSWVMGGSVAGQVVCRNSGNKVEAVLVADPAGGNGCCQN